MEIVKSFESDLNVTIKGTYEKPLFRASDIGAVLEIVNTRSMTKDFDNSEKAVVSIDTPGGSQEVTFLTEKGLYQVLFTSRKPIAKKFKNWVCEVIEEIRLNGKYELEKQLEEISKLKDQNLVNNFNKVPILYLSYAENDIAKPGVTDDLKRRLGEHKHDIRSDFSFEYVYESVYNREIERQLYQHPEMKKRRLEKNYNGKIQTELFKLDKNFTIQHIDKIIKKIKIQVESEEQDKDKNSEIDKLKLELIEKDKLINELKKQPTFTNPDDKFVYIETNVKGKNMYRISSSEDEIKDSKINFTYKSMNTPKIIDLVKILLKNYNKAIDDWTCIEYFKIKQILDFCILIYDHYEVNTNIEKLVHFIGKYNSTRLTNSNKARITIDKEAYSDFINEEIIIDNEQNVTCGMLCDQFFKWYKTKYNFDSDCDLSHIKSLQGNWNISFRDEFMKEVESVIKIKYESGCINVINKAKGLNFTKNSGFRGITLKNIENIRYYEQIVYQNYVKEFITITNNQKDKVARKEILDHFRQWTIFNGVFNPKCFGKIYAATFITEIIEEIEKITKLKLDPKKTKLRNMGIFTGMKHKNIE